MPEVVQTSAMDCGPAALKCLLEGHGVRASYGRLREACQIDLDGTSIDTIEEVAGELGLGAEQIMVPLDHLILPEAETLPAVVVVKQPNGLTHFVVVWRRVGPLLQVMDPAVGRRWPRARSFLSQVYVHRHRVPALGWREYAGSEDFLRPLAALLHHAGVPARIHLELADRAVADPSWKGLAALDAGARMVAALARTGGVRKGGEAARLLTSVVERAADGDVAACPEEYWSVRPAAGADEAGRDEWERDLEFHGAVLVRVRPPERKAKEAEGDASVATGAASGVAARAEQLSPELAAALSAPEPRPGRELLRHLRRAGRWVTPALLGLLAVAAGGVVFEALLFRGFIDVGRDLTVSHQRLAGVAVAALFLLLLLAAELPAVEGALRLGRQLETRLRVAFLRKIPRLRDRYFASRLTSDMAERSHSVHKLRRLPDLGEWLTRSVFELLLTTAGILWLDPGSAPLTLGTTAVVVALPLLGLPMIQELDLRVRNHSGALSRFYLDAFLGLVPIRTHAAERAVEREHEGLLLDWARANLLRERVTLAADAVLHLVALGLIGWLVLDHLARQGLTGAVLLLAYWALNLFVLGQLISLMLARQYPTYRNVTLRLLEPLGAREEGVGEGAPALGSEPLSGSPGTGPGATEEREERGQDVSLAGVEISYENVAVRAAGHTILRDVNFRLRAGEQVAVVGPSGAGKSTLVGLLLGWHRAAAGRVRVGGEPLTDARLPALRDATAWVDPSVCLWNRSLLENLRYGLPPDASPDVARVVDQAELLSVLELLPDGLQSSLGEGGGLVSGGEGQRVRLGRAMLRRNVRLVVLDEPFRGLDRRQRGILLQRARELWRGATLLCITHDVSETRGFPRVLVLEGGRVIEDGSPADVSALPGSRYQAMIEAEEAVRDGLWRSADWRRLRIEDGWLLEDRKEAR